MIDIKESDLQACVKAIRKIAHGIMQATDSEGFNIGMNNNAASGQSVMHSHFHIIPRKSEDGLHPWPQGSYKAGEMEEIQKRIISSYQ